jgi:queuine tRNA-ribosyltransferase
MKFQLLKRSSSTQARRGVLKTNHGVIQTPVFMPVGTLGSVKSLDARDVQRLGAGICLANAYHLMLRPGAEMVAKLGGLHRFSGYPGAILTDSGGFQVYSLAKLRKINDHGVTFRSHIDGSYHELTPERLVEVQELLGPDIAMVLDECPPGNADRELVERALERTTMWAKRAIEARQKQELAWFGIVQGACFEDLRIQHAKQMRELPFDGFAIGGVSVGEAPEQINSIVELTAPLLPADKPRYLMGVGTPADLIRGVAAGVDMFDCVMPTRNARNGSLFTREGKISIKNAEHKMSLKPVDAQCGCYTCTHVSRAFLRHLFMAKELTYHRLATLHNLTFYMDLMSTVRQRLDEDNFVPAEVLKHFGA